jgi:hypothetical protein
MAEPEQFDPILPQRLPYRPRWIWAGVALVLAGLGAGVVAIIAFSWVIAGVAVLVLLGGVGAAWHGRIMRDTHGNSGPLAMEWANLKEPRQHDTTGFDPKQTGHVIPDAHRAARHPAGQGDRC